MCVCVGNMDEAIVSYTSAIENCEGVLDAQEHTRAHALGASLAHKVREHRALT